MPALRPARSARLNPAAMGRLVAALFLLLVAGGAGASGTERFKAFVAGTQSATTRFEQKVFDSGGRLVQESRGSLSFARPGRFRWSYEKPASQLIVGDGTRVWVYDEELRQATVRRIGDALTSTPAALLAGNNQALAAFRLSDQGNRDGREWMQALPRDKEGGFERIRIGFGFSAPEVMELTDGFGQKTVLTFTGFENNPKLDAGAFRFTPPAGVDVLGDPDGGTPKAR